jgi:signal transduction histidine kinase/DNA-binding response OmpR family regulator
MKKTLILLIFFVSITSIGQNSRVVDSIQNNIRKAKTNSEKSKEYIALSKLTHNNDSAQILLKTSLKYARLANSSQYIYESRCGIAFLKEKKFNSDSAFNELRKVSKEVKTKKYQALLQYNFAEVHKSKNNLDSAKYYINKGISIAKSIKDSYTIARGYMLLGNISFSKYDYKDSFVQYLKSDSICEKSDSLRTSSFRAKTYNYLGYAVRKTHGYDKALDYYLKSKGMYQKLKDKIGIQEINIGLAQLYTNEGKFNEALPLLNEAVNYYKKMHNSSYTYALITRGYLFTKMKNFTAAEKDYQEYYDIIFKDNDKILQKRAVGYMAYLYYMKKDYEKSEIFYNRVMSMYGKEYDYGKLLLYEEIIELFKEKKDYQKLSKTYEDYVYLRNKLDEEGKNKEIFELETKYQTEKKEQEIKLLSTENKLAEKQKYIYLILLGLFLVTASFLFYGYRNKIKTAQKLNELNKLKSRFFANISHEFRTPLTLIKSPVQSLQSEINNENHQKKLHLIEKNSNRMLELVDQLLELSKIDSGNLKLILKEGNINSFLNSIIEPFKFQAKEHKLNFKSSIEKNNVNHHFDKDVIEKIVTNLLSNAFKYSDKNEVIIFSSSIEDNNLKIEISNTGTELKKEDLSKLFERFYQKNNNKQGAGIGLALVKELVALYKGKINTRIENNTLIFTIILPFENSNSNAVIISNENKISAIENTINSENELPILLIVDDNQDIRNILKDIFKNQFVVLEAEDGERAIKIARKEIPDCIISDVMMPKMSGFDFTKNIKSNELTSFIPVVLLTAKTSEESHLEGLQSSADAFLTKPFNHEIVKTTVLQLISERKKLQERYSQELVLKPIDIVINSIDEKFLEKLQEVLDIQLSNADFSTDDFATKIGMSRMQLHRKLKSLFGVSATEFLRNQRLKTAAELLKKGNGNISDIAYSVGFNDVSYFSKCFKEIYLCTPSEYSEKQ